MNLAFPSSRNSFHAGWLLLLVPPLISFAVVWWSDNPPVFNTIVGRLFLAMAVVLPLIWLRSGQVTGRAQRLLKELRTLMPGCLIATLMPALITLHDERGAAEWATWTYGFGCLLMGASAFGSEFEQRTMAGLLGQPVSRNVLFFEKLGVLLALLLFTTGNLLLSLVPSPGLQFDQGDAFEVMLVAVFAFCSGPLFSLLSRSTLAGLIFTITVPPVLYLGTTLIIHPVIRFLPLGAPSEDWLAWLLAFGTPVYLLATLLLGWRAFHRLEVRDGGAGGRASTGLHPLSLPVDSLLGHLLPAAGGTARLVRKELRLHVVPWLVAGLMIGLWVLWLTLRQFARDEDFLSTLKQVSAISLFASLLGALIVLGAGAACVAEERELGTLEWQLTQPASLPRQWLVKLAVTTVLGLTLGVLLPVMLVFTGFARAQLASEFADTHWLAWIAYAAVLVVAFAASIYASSFSRNTMKATAATMGTIAGLGSVIAFSAMATLARLDGLLAATNEQWQQGPIPPPEWAPSQTTVETLALVCVSGLTVLLVSALLWLGGRNFRRLVVPAATVVRQFVGLGAALALVTLTLGTVLTRLTLLQHQASQAENDRIWRAEAEQAVQSLALQGLLTADVYRRFSVATNANAAALAGAILASEGPNGVHKLQMLLKPAPKGTNNGITLDPALARRYGLSTDAGTNTGGPSARTNLPTYKMDPAMMKRYGLVPPTAPAPENP